MNKLPTVVLSVLILSLAGLLTGWILTRAVIHRNDSPRTISVKGMASHDFTSDLIIWKSTVREVNHIPQEGMRTVAGQTQRFKAFLQQCGIPDSAYVISPISFSKELKSEWNESQRRYIEIDNGYTFSQTITVSSSNVELIEKAYQNVGDLLNEGVMVQSNPPEYYYTKMGDLKLQMLSEAAADARERARQIASHSGAKLGTLKSSGMGVFQILGRHSNEDYTWGGVYNTSEKEKTASITVSSVFLLK